MINTINFDKIIETVKMTKSIISDATINSDIRIKGEADFVTVVDLEVSNFLKNKLAVITPDIGFMSEEDTNNKIPEIRWILDPIDGTTNFIYGYNMCSVSLALCVNETIVFGIVYNPFNDDTFVAYKNNGAFYNGQKMNNAPDRELNNCIVEFGAGATRKYHADIAFDIGKHVFKNCLDIRRICSSALAICYVAAGKINGYFEKELKPWDYAAASLILSECGGKVTDWEGNNISYAVPSSYVCGTPKLLDFLLDTIHEYDK